MKKLSAVELARIFGNETPRTDPVLEMLVRALLAKSEVGLTDSPIKAMRKARKTWEDLVKDFQDDERKKKEELDKKIKEHDEKNKKKHPPMGGVSPIWLAMFFFFLSPVVGAIWVKLFKVMGVL